MSTTNLEQAKSNLERYENKRKEGQKLQQNYSYLPEIYDENAVKQCIETLDDELDRLNKIKEKINGLNEENKLLSDDEIYLRLDDIIRQIEQLLAVRNNFVTYKEINDSMETTLFQIVVDLSNSRDDLFSNIFEDSIENNIPISSFVNSECLRIDKIKKPFMVALLTMDPVMIYDNIINSSNSLNEEQKKQVYEYIMFQKERIDRNLILSDKTLINLLESNTGKNILEQENVNSKNKYFQYCDQISYELFGKTIKEQLLVSSLEYVLKAFNDLSQRYRMFDNTEKNRIKQYLNYLNNSISREQKKYSDLNYSLGVLQPKSDRYNILNKRSNNYYSLNGRKIKRFSNNYSDDFNRTIDDMRIANFPIIDVENYIFDCFSSNRVSREIKQQLIATVLDNLQLCYDMFNSYYNSGNMSLTSYLNMSDGNRIELNYKLDETNLPHILGIPKSHQLDKSHNIVKLNLPINTLRILGLRADKPSSALVILQKILERKEDIINAVGCFKGEDDNYYEMLPWEKIILKTNAFIRGDFFKSTSFISGINPDSYLIMSDDQINAVSINSTYFSESAINQQVPNIRMMSPLVTGGSFINGRNSLFQKNKDLILKGLIAQYEQDKIKRISGVKTNESFIGERQKKVNGIPIKTMNKPVYLLENVKPGSGGIVTSIENPIGYCEYSIDEQILLLEDMALTFENNPNIIDVIHKTIEQIESFSKKKKL